MKLGSLILVMVGLLAACGGSDEDTIDSTPGIDAAVTIDAMPDPMLNGCTRAAATNMKGMASVTVTNTQAWSIPHQVCIVVDAGTQLTWEGNFSAHPLAGGQTGTVDAASPIGAGSGTTPFVVTLGTAGTYPYFCSIHLSSMQGVVYVE